MKEICGHQQSRGTCLVCSSDGSEELRFCPECLALSWHRKDDCLRCRTRLPRTA